MSFFEPLMAKSLTLNSNNGRRKKWKGLVKSRMWKDQIGVNEIWERVKALFFLFFLGLRLSLSKTLSLKLSISISISRDLFLFSFGFNNWMEADIRTLFSPVPFFLFLISYFFQFPKYSGAIFIFAFAFFFFSNFFNAFFKKYIR